MLHRQKADDLRGIIQGERARLAATGNYHFDEKAHKYHMYGQVVPSVTKVISSLPPDLLMNSAFIRKTQIGTDTHTMAEYYVDEHMGWGEVPEPDFNPVALMDMGPYVAGVRKFLEREKYTFVSTELRVHSELYKTAGTLDILAINSKGHLVLMDWKTVTKLSPTVGLQLAAYAKFYWEMFGKLTKVKVKHREAIWLTGDGDYKIVPYKNPDDESVFMCKLISHQWDVLNKIK